MVNITQCVPIQADRGQFRGMHMHRGEPLTDAKRAELTQQYDQRLAQRQAREQACDQSLPRSNRMVKPCN